MSEQNSSVKSLNKAIAILDLLSVEEGGLKLSEIALRCGFPKSTTHALLSTMRDKGLIRQLDNGSYSLGIKLFEYGAAVSRSFDINRLARPYLERLSSLTGCSSVISMVDNRGVVAFDYAANAGGVQIMPEIGVRLPLHATSQGKLMLAFLSHSRAVNLLEKTYRIAFTPHTVTDKDRLLERLSQIQSDGYAVEDGEYKIGLRSISAPVLDVEGRLRYILTVIGFFRRTQSDEFRLAAEHTISQAALLSSALGYQHH